MQFQFNIRFILPGLLLPLFLLSCANGKGNEDKANKNTVNKVSREELKESQTAYFASGCFWCVEAIFESVKGVKEAESGYAGGEEPNPTYEQVSGGATSHAEAVKVYYDSSVIDYPTLLEVYYDSHNPTTVNGQDPDFGRQYRSIIFYENEEEKQHAEEYKSRLDNSGEFKKPIATEIIPLEKFWIAEDYHQDYEQKHPDDRYIRNVSIPRINKFKKRHPELLKEGH